MADSGAEGKLSAPLTLSQKPGTTVKLMNSEVNKGFCFGEFELDRERRLLLKRGEAVNLNPKTFDLLLALVENHGQMLTKNDLLDKVWENQFVEENNLTVHVAALRKALGETKNDHRFIVTVPGKGYRFVAELNEPTNGEIVVESRKIERIIVDEEVVENRSKELREGTSSRKRILALSVIAVLILSGVFAAYKYFLSAPKTPISSLAVLPFVNQNNDVDTDYLSDGLSENVIYSLSQSPNLRVISRNSAFRYKGREAEARTVGRELNVQAIVTGRVLQRGGDLIVSAELISVQDDSVIWGEQFTRKMSDVAKLQTDIAKAISDRLRLKLSGEKKREAENGEAYQLYLQALYSLNKRTPDHIKKSIGFFQQAIDRDASYAQAYAGLAMAHSILESHSVMSK
jgi:TolB-like protein/DNA-binding winged helix-turn-helix (wHTH) protein